MRNWTAAAVTIILVVICIMVLSAISGERWNHVDEVAQAEMTAEEQDLMLRRIIVRTVAQKWALRTEVTTMRLIDAESAMSTPVLPKEYRNYQTDNLDDAYERGWEDALGNLKNAPTVDAVPVVRCKGCKYLVNATVNSNGFLICHVNDMEIAPEDFCSYGERKESRH